jgi:hypothetical protein
MNFLVPVACVALAVLAPVSPEPPVQRVTVDWLESLKTTSNDPAGDRFIGSRDQLTRSVDAIVADSSLVSPSYLLIASKTAFTLNRVEDAAFLFYAGQLRAMFDFDRHDVDRQPDGNNAATRSSPIASTAATCS